MTVEISTPADPEKFPEKVTAAPPPVYRSFALTRGSMSQQAFAAGIDQALNFFAARGYGLQWCAMPDTRTYHAIVVLVAPPNQSEGEPDAGSSVDPPAEVPAS